MTSVLTMIYFEISRNTGSTKLRKTIKSTVDDGANIAYKHNDGVKINIVNRGKTATGSCPNNNKNVNKLEL